MNFCLPLQRVIFSLPAFFDCSLLNFLPFGLEMPLTADDNDTSRLRHCFQKKSKEG